MKTTEFLLLIIIIIIIFIINNTFKLFYSAFLQCFPDHHLCSLPSFSVLRKLAASRSYAKEGQGTWL